MMLERSIQAQFLIPTTIALSFGVLCATFVTLLLVPALFLIGEDLHQLLHKIKLKLLGRSETVVSASS